MLGLVARGREVVADPGDGVADAPGGAGEVEGVECGDGLGEAGGGLAEGLLGGGDGGQVEPVVGAPQGRRVEVAGGVDQGREHVGGDVVGGGADPGHGCGGVAEVGDVGQHREHRVVGEAARA